MLQQCILRKHVCKSTCARAKKIRNKSKTRIQFPRGPVMWAWWATATIEMNFELPQDFDQMQQPRHLEGQTIGRVVVRCVSSACDGAYCAKSALAPRGPSSIGMPGPPIIRRINIQIISNQTIAQTVFRRFLMARARARTRALLM